jgi:hypothetical protein
MHKKKVYETMKMHCQSHIEWKKEEIKIKRNWGFRDMIIMNLKNANECIIA